MRRTFAISLLVTALAACTGGVLDGQALTSRVAVHPQLPEAAKQHTSAGAIALAGYYFETLAWTLRTGDVDPAAAIADPRCSECNALVSSFRHGHADSAFGLVRLVLDTTVLLRHQVFIGAEYGVAVTYHASVDEVVQPLATDVRSGPYHMSVWVDWRGGGWRIVSLGLA
jgi:hypothetical protein